MSVASVKREQKNKGFTQVYDLGWDRLQHLMKESPLAARVYAYMAQNCDEEHGYFAITQDLLASELGVTRRAIYTATKLLSDEGIVPRFKLSGNAYLYALSPQEIWKTDWDKKRTAVFYSLVAVDVEAVKKELENIKIKSKLPKAS